MEFWEIFVDDSTFCLDACSKHANVQSAVFSYAMTVMDKICGWEDEEKWVGKTPEMEEYLKRRLLSIMLCMNWVCAGTFDGYEWVSESTITQQEEVMGRELDYENCVQCGAVVLGANTVFQTPCVHPDDHSN